MLKNIALGLLIFEKVNPDAFIDYEDGELNSDISILHIEGVSPTDVNDYTLVELAGLGWKIKDKTFYFPA